MSGHYENAQVNPMGTDGFEFVEYAAPDGKMLHDLFRAMGFSPVARHRDKAITLYRQGEVSFLVNEEPDSFAARFAEEHGPCAVGFAVRVADADAALEHARSKDATPMTEVSRALDVPAIEGIGGSLLYLVDTYGEEGDAFEEEYVFEGERNPEGYGLSFIDHLTHNVHYGNMDVWRDFYERIFNFHEIRYFDIKGQATGLVSRAMTSPDGQVKIPLNESSDEKSQINEYLREYNGEGIQHIALFTDNIYETVESMREQDIRFLDVPDTYYEMVDERIPEHGEDLERMSRNRILIDADPEQKDKQLLQIFTQTNIGPIFFEIIQRKGNEGFGEGNFKALFESIERDQMKRGVI